MEEESLEDKQKYLRENILDKGYDPMKFMNFLKEKKGEAGSHIENWSLEELHSVTQEFVSSNTIDNKLDLLSNEDDNSEEKEKEDDGEKNEKGEESKEEKKEEQKVNQDINDAKIKKCTLIGKTPITDLQKITIKVSDPQVEKKGYFSFSYSTYLIHSEELNIKIRRKFSDVLWLYETLKQFYNNYVVPPFYKKVDSTESEMMKSITNIIETFLNNVGIHPVLRNSKMFYEFLSIKNEKEFEQKMQSYKKMKIKSDIKNMRTLNGEIKWGYSPGDGKKYEDIKSKLNIHETYFNELITNYNSLIDSINIIIVKMNDISKIWKKFSQINMKISETTRGVFDSYSKAMENWAGSFSSHNFLIYNQIIKFFEFINKEFAAFKMLSTTVDNTRMNFEKKENKYENDKKTFCAKPENAHLRNKEEIFIKNHQKELEEKNLAMETYGCYLNSYISEYERIRDLNDKRFKENIFGFVNQLIAQTSGTNYCMSDILSYIDTLK